jgi:hypothetical protein
MASAIARRDVQPVGIDWRLAQAGGTCAADASFNSTRSI